MMQKVCIHYCIRIKRLNQQRKEIQTERPFLPPWLQVRERELCIHLKVGISDLTTPRPRLSTEYIFFIPDGIPIMQRIY